MRTAASLRFVALALLALAPLASADVVITGKVVDENDAPVKEVRITVSPAGVPNVSSGASTTVQAAFQATTDAAGLFRLDLPEPGNYRIQAQQEGFFVFTDAAVALEDGTPLEIRMNHIKELTDSVDVHYSPPVIDPQQTSDTKTLNSQQILNVPYPASQDYRNALPLMTGAILDNAGQVHLNGGDTSQANYRLNGFDISDPATGGLNARLNVETVQTLEWDASRFSPAEGKGSAGVVDIKTQMGDDHWRFGGTNFIPGFGSQDGLHLDHWSPRAVFSGPIKKGRAWFHNAFDAFYTVSTVSGLPRSQNQARSLTTTDLTRLQWNITNSHILTASFLANIGDFTRTGLSFLTPAEATVNQRTSLFVGTIKDQWSVGGGLVEIGYAHSQTYLQSSPQGTEPYVITPFGAQGNYFLRQTASTGRQEGLVNVFLAPIHAAGTHQIQIGLDAEHSSLDQLVDRNQYISVNANNVVVRNVQFLGSPQQFVNNVEAYAYVLDRWSPVESLMIEAGFRTQWDRWAGSGPVAPRLAASWSPKWSGGTRFSAGWGIFYDAVTLNMIALSQEQTGVSTYYAPSGAVAGVPVETQFVLEPHDLRLARFELSSLSAERKLPWGVYGKVNLIDREGSRGFTFRDELVQPSLNLYVIDNIQRQRYRAAEFAFRRTFLSRYQWFASYTRSEASANAVINYSINNPVFAPQAGGPLPWDAPNRFLAWGWAPVEKSWFPRFLRPIIGDTDVQMLVDYRTGFPFGLISQTGNAVGAPNSQRFPSFGTVNIALERRFLFHGYLWAWRVGLVNALSRPNPNAVNNDVDSPEFLTYGNGQGRAVNVRLRFLGKK